MRRPALTFACLAALLAAVAFAPSLVGAEDARPGCAAGPQRVGATIEGTACDDVIVVPPSVRAVDAGPGDDTIVAAPIAVLASCPAACHLGIGSQEFDGGPGDDIVFGERGNDILRGGEGDDRLFGGIGDDQLLGGPGADRLSGGFGADSIDGEAGDDRVRGDGTIDRIYDSGGGTDTLSYATGVTPSAFGGPVGEPVASDFPPPDGERGVRLLLGQPGQNANNGIAAYGGGVDEVEAGVFERIVGTPFSDWIVGTGAAEEIYGGGGADVIEGGGGADTLVGGADGDRLDGAGTVEARDTSLVSVGFMQPTDLPDPGALYVTGSDGDETITATYSAAAVSFALAGTEFDQSAAAQAGCEVEPTTATCPLPAAGLDSVVIAGMGGDDTIEAASFPSAVGVVLLGGDGDDELEGGAASEDALVDGLGDGADTLLSLGGDDILIHNGGADRLEGGEGNDLFLSVSVCDGQLLDGGGGRDNGSWARLSGQPVAAWLEQGRAGAIGAGGVPTCGSGEVDQLSGIEDLEGSSQADYLVGDAGPNQLLGHLGSDSYFSREGDDSILANSGDDDAWIDCGAGAADSALIDFHPQFNDPAPIDCETIREGSKDNYRTVTQLPPPPLAVPPLVTPPPAPAPPVLDRRPPRTRITHRPPRRLAARKLPRQVAFRFTSNEAGGGFRCRIDRRPWHRCEPPSRFRVGRGGHSFRVFAIDAAGNRDRSAAVFRFAIRRGTNRHHR